MPLSLLVLTLLAAAGSIHCCPVGQYPSETTHPVCMQCPAHTTTLGGPDTAVTIHDCKCEAGFLCMYYKQVHATVTLNTTLSDFENNHHGVRSLFLSGVAAAAGVSQEQIRVHFVVIRLNHRRRRRLQELPNDTIQVRVVVSSGVSSEDSISKLHRHLSGMQMTADSWVVRRRVLVLAIPTSGI